MKFIVEVRPPMPEDLAGVAEKLAEAFHISPAKAQTLLRRAPGPVTKPVSEREAGVVAGIFASAGLSVVTVGQDDATTAVTPPPVEPEGDDAGVAGGEVVDADVAEAGVIDADGADAGAAGVEAADTEADPGAVADAEVAGGDVAGGDVADVERPSAHAAASAEAVWPDDGGRHAVGADAVSSEARDGALEEVALGAWSDGAAGVDARDAETGDAGTGGVDAMDVDAMDVEPMDVEPMDVGAVDVDAVAVDAELASAPSGTASAWPEAGGFVEDAFDRHRSGAAPEAPFEAPGPLRDDGLEDDGLEDDGLADDGLDDLDGEGAPVAAAAIGAAAVGAAAGATLDAAEEDAAWTSGAAAADATTSSSGSAPVFRSGTPEMQRHGGTTEAELGMHARGASKREPARGGVRRRIAAVGILPALCTLLVMVAAAAFTLLPVLRHQQVAAAERTALAYAASIEGLRGGLPLAAPLVTRVLADMAQRSQARLADREVAFLVVTDDAGVPLAGWSGDRLGVVGLAPEVARAVAEQAGAAAVDPAGALAGPEGIGRSLALSWRAVLAMLGLAEPGRVVASAAIRDPGGVAGAVVVGVDQAALWSDAGRALSTTLLLGLIPVLLAILAAMALARRVTRGLRYLLDAADRISRGDLEHEVRLDSKDELGQLARAIERMRVSLQEGLERLRRRR